MKLIATMTSPYARAVRVVLAERKIEYALVDESPGVPGNTVSDFNPLGKIPVLALADGYSVYDSRVDLRQPDRAWRVDYPNLAQLADKLAKRPSFAETLPPAG